MRCLLSYNRALPVYSGRLILICIVNAHDNVEMKAFKAPAIVSNKVCIFISVNPPPMISFSRAGVGPGRVSEACGGPEGPLCPGSDRGDRRRLCCVAPSLLSAPRPIWLPLPHPLPLCPSLFKDALQANQRATYSLRLDFHSEPQPSAERQTDTHSRHTDTITYTQQHTHTQ